MVGTIGKLSNRIGGYSIVNKNGNNINIKVPAGSKILCNNCTLENESTLISNNSVIKTTVGYDILVELDLTILRETLSPLTVLRGREIIFAENVLSTDYTQVTFNLPKGARVNQTIVASTGEISIPISTNYLIEY